MEQETTFTIEILRNDLNTLVEQSLLDNAIVVEDGDEPRVVSRIRLSGKYSRTYDVVTQFLDMIEDRILIDGDIMIVCLYSDIAVIDLSQDKLLNTFEFNCWEIFGIYKFKSGYFLRGEGDNYFLDKDFNIVWECGAVDIFANPLVEKDFEIFEDYVTAFDWSGEKHYYNEHGEYKRKYFPKYDTTKPDHKPFSRRRKKI